MALNGGRYLRVELIGKPLGHGPCHKLRQLSCILASSHDCTVGKKCKPAPSLLLDDFLSPHAMLSILQQLQPWLLPCCIAAQQQRWVCVCVTHRPMSCWVNSRVPHIVLTEPDAFVKCAALGVLLLKQRAGQ